MFNYGTAPGGGYAYQMPVNGYSTNQPQCYSQPTTYGTPTTSGWVQPQYTPVQSSGFTNYPTPNVSYSQPVNQGWVPVQNTGWYNTPQQSYQHSHNHGYHHSHGYNMPYMGGGGGCGNCGSSVPMIRRDCILQKIEMINYKQQPEQLSTQSQTKQNQENQSQRKIFQSNKTQEQTKPKIIGSGELELKQVQPSSSHQTQKMHNQASQFLFHQGCTFGQPNAWNEFPNCPPQFSHHGHPYKHHKHSQGSQNSEGFRQ